MRVLIICLLTCVFLAKGAEQNDFRGTHFIGFEDFSRFTVAEGQDGTALALKVDPGFLWDELIASWNLRGAAKGLLIEARAVYPGRTTKWYTLARWTLNPTTENARSSVRGQKDEDGTVHTDTLKLKERASAVEVRVTLDKGADVEALKFLGLSFCDSNAPRSALPPKESVWGNVLAVKERSQANYPEGISEWCSPTSMSMLMSFWSAKLNRPELDYDVPEVARGVNDPGWPGTGNWPFNTAFAGAHAGMRSYVTRFSDVSELEDWVEAGIPVAVSVAYGYLKGNPDRANGHLVVCIGFDENGNIVVNDPGRRQVRQVYTRDNLIKAWAESENTVYIVHPESWRTPKDRFGHWFP